MRRWMQNGRKIERLVEKKELRIITSEKLLINSVNFVKIPPYSNRVPRLRIVWGSLENMIN